MSGKQSARLFTMFVALALLFCSVAIQGQDRITIAPEPSGDRLDKDTWTEIGIYGFISDIRGDVRIGNVESNVDVSFDDILGNLDIGFMGYVEHRRGKWSFLLDVAYLKLEAEKTESRNAFTTVTLDAELEQTLLEGLVGYRVFEGERNGSRWGMDLLAGFRYNDVSSELDATASLLGLTTSRSRSPSQDWVDVLLAVRAQYEFDGGFGISVYADIGKGEDSDSFQVIGTVSYRFENNLKIFAGYRHLNLNYGGKANGRDYDFDLDYVGPMLGVAYRF